MSHPFANHAIFPRTTQIDLQDFDPDVKSFSGLSWPQPGANQNVLESISGTGGADTGTSFSSSVREFPHAAPSSARQGEQTSHGFMFGGAPSGGASTATTTTLDAQSSLRDLLLEKWPPVPISEVTPIL